MRLRRHSERQALRLLPQHLPDEAGDEHVIATTQFESTDAAHGLSPAGTNRIARRSSRSPSRCEAHLFAISNGAEFRATELPGGKRRLEFTDTMPMSTYLVAFVVGPLEATEAMDVDGTPLRVVHTAGKQHLTTFALEAGAHALRFFARYFDQPYPGDKLDLVAIPDFAFGAMENLGCVTFREAALLTDPDNSARNELETVAGVVEHEIAHMWFGDLVTMRLVERHLVERGVRDLHGPLLPGRLPAGVPVLGRVQPRPGDGPLPRRAPHHTTDRVPRAHPDEVDSMFDALTYEKGGSVLRMLELYLGTARFREGVRRYLAAHRYGNTETTDLWDAIEEAADGLPVRALMDSWIFQGGHPLVTASANGPGPADARAVLLPAVCRPARGLQSRARSARIGSSRWPCRDGLCQEGPAAESHYELLREQPVRVPRGPGCSWSTSEAAASTGSGTKMSSSKASSPASTGSNRSNASASWPTPGPARCRARLPSSSSSPW